MEIVVLHWQKRQEINAVEIGGRSHSFDVQTQQREINVNCKTWYTVGSQIEVLSLKVKFNVACVAFLSAKIRFV